MPIAGTASGLAISTPRLSRNLSGLRAPTESYPFRIKGLSASLPPDCLASAPGDIDRDAPAGDLRPRAIREALHARGKGVFRRRGSGSHQAPRAILISCRASRIPPILLRE